MANATPVPTSGTISFDDILLAFPNINQRNLLAYRGAKYQIAGTPTLGYFPTGSIDMNMFRGKVYPQFLKFVNTDQAFYLGSRTSYIYPGCYRAGWVDLYVQVINGEIWLRTSQVGNDYAFYNFTNYPYNFNFTFPFFFLVKAGRPQNFTSSPIMPLPRGRDAMKFQLIGTVIPGSLKVDVYCTCKGFGSDSAGSDRGQLYYTIYIPTTYDGGYDGIVTTPGTNYRLYWSGDNGTQTTPNKYGNLKNNIVSTVYSRTGNGSQVSLRVTAIGGSVTSTGEYTTTTTPCNARAYVDGNLIASVTSSGDPNTPTVSNFVTVGVNYNSQVQLQVDNGIGGLEIWSNTYSEYLFVN